MFKGKENKWGKHDTNHNYLSGRHNHENGITQVVGARPTRGVPSSVPIRYDHNTFFRPLFVLLCSLK